MAPQLIGTNGRWRRGGSLVNRACHDLFAGAGLTKDQHVAVEGSHLPDQMIDLADKRATTGRQNRRACVGAIVRAAYFGNQDGSFSHGFVVP